MVEAKDNTNNQSHKVWNNWKESQIACNMEMASEVWVWEERPERDVLNRFQLCGGGNAQKNHCVSECVGEM